MTFLEQFTEVKQCLERKNTKKCEEWFAIQVTMTDDDCGGVFYIANTENGFSVEPYDYKDHTAHMIADSKILLEILEGKKDPVKAYLEGKVKAEGNLEHIKLIASLTEKPKSKAPAKKPAEKKAVEKKTIEKKPAEKKAVEKKTVEKKPAEKKTVEKKTVEKKPTEKKTTTKKK